MPNPHTNGKVSASNIKKIREIAKNCPGEEDPLLSRCSSIADDEGAATMASEDFSLVKNVVATGALALSSGIAVFGNAYSAIFPATILTILLGVINAYYFSLIGRVCSITGARSYREAWESSVGKRGSFLVSLACSIGPAALGALSCSMILADSILSLFVTAGFQECARTKCLWLITGVVVFPLCLLKNLRVLAPFSMLGIACILFTLIAMMVRYFDGTYDSEKTGKFVQDLPLEYQPSFGSIGAAGVFSFRAFPLLCMLAQAYLAHYNAPRFYFELKNHTIPRFDIVVFTSYAISAAFNILIGVVGFLTFGENSDGYILNNYSTNDVAASLSRLAITTSVVFSYPIIFVGVRDGTIDLLQIPIDAQTYVLHVGLTAILLLILTIIATFVQDLGVVNSLGGATLGTAVIYICPSIMFSSAVKNLGIRATEAQQMEVIFTLILMCLGIVIGSIGVVMALT